MSRNGEPHSPQTSQSSPRVVIENSLIYQRERVLLGSFETKVIDKPNMREAKWKTRTRLILVSGLILVLLLIVIQPENPVLLQPDTMENLQMEQLGPQLSSDGHAPIVINGDAEFDAYAAAEGWLGSGSSVNPYQITGLEFDMAGESGNCIEIHDTTVYFIVRDCIFAVGTQAGIYLDHVGNGTIEDNAFSGGTWGVYLSLSSNTMVLNNTFNHHSDAGVELDHNSAYNVVTNNTFSYCGYYSILLRDYSGYSRVEGNIIENTVTYDGIALLESDFSIVSKNTISHNMRYGIYLDDGSEYNNVTENHCFENEESGIMVRYSSHNNLTRNLCTDNYVGMYNYQSDYNILANNTCNDNIHGIYVDYTSHTTVRNNTCMYNHAGVTSRYSGPNTIVENTFVEGGLYMFATGSMENSRQTEVADNTLNGLPVIFWQDVEGGTVPTGAGQVILVNCTGVSVVDQTISDAAIGIQLILSENCRVANNVLSHNSEGIRVDSASFNIVEDNILISNDYEGIHIFWHADSNIVRRNICRENTYGIYLLGSVYNTVANNTCQENDYGIFARSDSEYNIIEWNVFFENTENAATENTLNTFQYNYYSDYSGLDMDGNGIGDTPYYFSPSVDYYPLILPIGYEPVWLIEPLDTIAEFCMPFDLQLFAAAAPPGISNWWLNDTDNFSIDLFGLVTNATFLPKGDYGLEVSLNDIYGHVLTAEFTITVINNLPPTWDEAPQDIFLYPWSILHYDLNASDPSGIDMWWLDDTTNFTIDQEGILTNATILSDGYYIIKVFVNDTEGHVLMGTFTIFTDFSPPYPHDAIRIDGDDDFHAQAAAEGWPGSGTQEDPYRIEYWEISMESVTGHCIEIRNTRVHFIVQECVLRDSQVSQYAGIYLYNVSDGSLSNNLLLQNWAGIRLTNSSHIDIDSNNCTNSVWYGIWLEVDSTYNWLFNNTCDGAGQHGIYLYDGCAHNEILNNTISNMANHGISLTIDCGFSTVANNTCTATNHGIVIDRSPECVVSFNNCSYNVYDGIYVVNTDISTITNNTCIGNNRHGVVVILSNYVTVADNTLSENTYDGIVMDRTSQSSIMNNILDSNGRYGILVYTSSSYIVIVNNLIVGNNHGMRVENSAYCTITENTCNANSGYGLYLYNSQYCSVTNNTCNNNGNRGICLEYSNYNDVVDNICDDNYSFGIVLYYSNYNLVENNKCHNGASEGAHIRQSRSNTIANNTFSGYNMGIRIFESSSDNTITNNTCIDNTEYGIYIDSSSAYCNVWWNAFIDSIYPAYNDQWYNVFEYNYYSDYTGLDADGNGIGDTDYFVSPYLLDLHPLMLPPGSPLSWYTMPVDQTVEYGQPFTYDLDATASPPGIDLWWIDDTTNFSIDQQGIIMNATILIEGEIYSLQIWVNDTFNNILTVHIHIYVIEVSPPMWVETPTNQVAELGYPFVYNLNATDPSGISHWWIDDTIHFAIDDNGIITNIIPLVYGATYPVQVWVNDTLDNTLTATFLIAVEDNTPPEWVFVPSDQAIAEDESLTYDLDATDPSGIDSWWLNDTGHFAIDSNGVITNISALSVGIYGIQIWVNDTLGNTLTATFDVKVVETIYVVVIRGYFTGYSGSYACWNEINNYWFNYGDTRVIIDYTSLSSATITLPLLESIGADVLIMGYSGGMSYSQAETDAIIAYVQQGHGFVATHNSLYSAGNRLNSLFGLIENINWYSGYPYLYDVLDSEHPVLRSLPDPFSFYYDWAYNPSGNWGTAVLDGADYIAMDSSGQGAILVYQGLVYCSTIAEYMVHPQGTQFIYNALCWSRRTLPEEELRLDIDVPSSVNEGDTVTISATVWNYGTSDATNIVITLLIDDTEVDIATISELLSEASETVPFTWEATEAGLHNVTVQITILPLEENPSDNIAMQFVDVTPSHELGVTLSVPSFVYPDSSVTISTTVTNYGFNDEMDIVLTLLINDISVDSLMITELLAGASETLVYSWLVEEEGQYNVTAFVEVLPLEEGLFDNIATTMVLAEIETGLHDYDLQEIGFQWYDAMTNGISFGMSGDDICKALTLPFTFRYYDQDFDTVYVGSNGWMSFSYTNPREFSNYPFPQSTYWLDYAVAPFWDDLMVSNNVYVWLTTEFAVIQYNNVVYYPGSPTAGTFQVVLFANGQIAFNYLSMNRRSSSTIGLNYGDGVYFNSYPESNIGTGLHSILFTYGPPAHDLSVFLNIPTSVAPGVPILLMATVENLGANTEYDIDLSLFLNETEVCSLNIEEMIPGAEMTLTYVWVPDIFGVMNVTAKVTAVPDEDIVGNNRMIRLLPITELQTYTMTYMSPQWYDAAAHGVNLHMDGDDTCATVFLPFEFQFYDRLFDRVYVSSNGWLSFTWIYPSADNNPEFPSSDLSTSYAIAPYWDSLWAQNNVYGWFTDDWVVIQFDNILYDPYYNNNKAGTFQVVLFADGRIMFNYLEMFLPGTATVGINYGDGIHYNSIEYGDLFGNGGTTILFEYGLPEITSLPWIETPIDQTVEFGELLSYDMSNNPLCGIQTWWIDDTVNFVINDGILTSTSALPVGVYPLEVRVYYTEYLFCSAVITITVEDTIAPVWGVVPSDQTVEFGTIMDYDLFGLDRSGIDHYWVNDTLHFLIVDGSITSIAGLAVGEYGIEVRAYDPYGNVVYAIFCVTVVDTTSPDWVTAPTDQTCEYGDDFEYQLYAEDLSGIDQWWIGDSHFTISNGLISNLVPLDVGDYSLQVWLNDTYGNIETIQLTVFVRDTTSPTWILSPVDQIVELGDPFLYDLDEYDLSELGTWSILGNSQFTVDQQGTISNATYIDVGIYEVTVQVTDIYGNPLISTFYVTVQDTVQPCWCEDPEDQINEYGDDFYYDLDVTDLSTIDQWWVNDTTLFAIDPYGVIRSTTMLPLDTYGIEVSVCDIWGNTLVGEFTVVVIDTTPPSWLGGIPDRVISYGIEFECSLTAWDLHGVVGWVINDTDQFVLDWEVDGAVSTARIRGIGLLDPGVYGLQVELFDSSGNHLVGEFSVTVSVTQLIEMELSGSFDYLLKEKIYLQIAAMLKDATTGMPISGATVTATIYGPEFDDKGDAYEERFVMTVTLVEEVPGSGVYIFTTEETMKDMDLEKGIYLVYCTAALPNGAEVMEMMQFHIDPPSDSGPLSISTMDVLYVGISVGIIVVLIGFAKHFSNQKRK